MQIVYAAGPFTTHKTLNYNAFKNFLDKMRTDAPNVLILQGPFIDFENEPISNCQLAYKDGNMESFATFEDLFKDLMT